jgi:hypothetical protein
LEGDAGVANGCDVGTTKAIEPICADAETILRSTEARLNCRKTVILTRIEIRMGSQEKTNPCGAGRCKKTQHAECTGIAQAIALLPQGAHVNAEALRGCADSQTSFMEAPRPAFFIINHDSPIIAVWTPGGGWPLSYKPILAAPPLVVASSGPRSVFLGAGPRS